jgi:putative DNA primase/helicase
VTIAIDNQTDAGLYPANDDPYRTADRLAMDGHLNGWTRRDGTWWQWTGKAYEARDDKAFRAYLGSILKTKAFASKTGKKPWAPNRPRLSNLIDAITVADVPDPDSQVLALDNGLYDPATRKLLPHTPTRFVSSYLAYAYDKSAKCPQWNEFLRSVWPNDPDSIALLQEWMGYVVSGDTRRHKAMLMIGPTRSGKGVIQRIAEALIGDAQCAAVKLGNANSWFAAENLTGKSVAIIGDLRLDGSLKPSAQEFLLSTIGGDLQQVMRHGREAENARLRCRIFAATNITPIFTDPAKVLPTRFLYLVTGKSYLDQEDDTLEDRLKTELPGILNWCLDGLDRLTANGRWTVPKVSQAVADGALRIASPVGEFVDELCRLDGEVPTKVLYDEYKTWRLDNGHPPMSSAQFGAALSAVVPQVRNLSGARNAEGKRARRYVGISLA